MNNKQFISELAGESSFTKDDTQRLVNTLIQAMGDMFEEGKAVTVPSFGTFEVKKRMERVVVNPSTGKRMLVPPKLVLGFRPAAAVKEQLKSKEGAE